MLTTSRLPGLFYPTTGGKDDLFLTREDLFEYGAYIYQLGRECSHLHRNELLEMASRLAVIAKRLHHYNETACCRDLTGAEHLKLCDLTREAESIAKRLKVGVRYNADPRGCALKLLLPSGAANCWDGESYGVPEV